MDIISKRELWRFISKTKKGRIIVLTTHSMEECEALCDRIGIMQKGRLLCIGTSSYLKAKLGNHYNFEVRLIEGDLDTFNETQAEFPGKQSSSPYHRYLLHNF